MEEGEFQLFKISQRNFTRIRQSIVYMNVKFLRLIMKGTKKISNADRAAIFRQLIFECPVCNQSLNKHSIALFSSIVIDENTFKETNFDHLISERKWEDASKIREGTQNRDMRQYYLLKCPNSGMALLRFKFTYELWSNDQLESSQVLSEEDVSILEALILDGWISL